MRRKNPRIDLKLKYRKTLAICLGLSLTLHLFLFLFAGQLEVKPYEKPVSEEMIKIEDIPETPTRSRPSPPMRPSVPIVRDGIDVPAEATIEPTELDLDEVPPVPPLPPPPPELPRTDEVIDFFRAEVKPRLVKSIKPEYPEVARRAGIEGMVILHLLVGKDGRVRKVLVIKAPGEKIEISKDPEECEDRAGFIKAAVEAVWQFEFTPALQNGRPVRVWVSLPVKFVLTD
ncbi:MAG TPA: energy transducer TonB [Candidatus Latescibacteria bacterium]|nr:energy transducer TonB [Candidatus Latescibacterota bacterium]